MGRFACWASHGHHLILASQRKVGMRAHLTDEETEAHRREMNLAWAEPDVSLGLSLGGRNLSSDRDSSDVIHR